MSDPRTALTVAVAKLARIASRLRGGGSAFPGFVARRLTPDINRRLAGSLPFGVLFVMGSNGKSTTTNMLTSVLRAHGLRVFTNNSGANMPQGIASSLIGAASLGGRVDADIAVLEVDEGYGAVLARELRPKGSLILNLVVDQIYRFHEPDRVADMFRAIIAEVEGPLVLNADDAFVRGFGEEAVGRSDLSISWFGASEAAYAAAPHGLVAARDFAAEGSGRALGARPQVGVEVLAQRGAEATLRIGADEASVRLPSRGLHYAVDAAAAIELARAALGDRFQADAAKRGIDEVAPVYGRGEVIPHANGDIEILMNKNLASLQLNMDFLEAAPESVLIAYDESSYDPSWLYSADFSKLERVEAVAGPKASFMALRLGYLGIPVGLVEPDIGKALDHVLATPRPTGGTRTFFLDHDQMMAARRHLGYRDLEAGSA